MKIDTWDTAKTGYPVADFINSTVSLSNYNKGTPLWSGWGAYGHNTVNLLTPNLYKRGSILAATAISGAFGINTESSARYQDFDKAKVRLNAINQNLYINLIAQSTISIAGQATRVNSFSHTYSSPGSYNLRSSFNCRGVTYQDEKTIEGEYSVIGLHRCCTL